MRYKLSTNANQLHLGFRGWFSVAVGLALFATTVILAGILALGFLVLILPLVGLGAAYIYYLKKKLAGNAIEIPRVDVNQSTNRSKVIEGTYSKLDGEEL